MRTAKYKIEILNAVKKTLLSYHNIGIAEIELNSSKERLLQNLKNEVLHCNRCLLYTKRKNCVFGEGNPDAQLMFVGEAPGYYEDVQGKPFVGRAGQLLTKIINAMKLKRNDVYIANILKCRPPENRDPLEEEMNSCFPFLDKQIEIIKPKVICALGRYASQILTGSSMSITHIRGNIFYYKGIKVIPTFHPSYLLRNPQHKKEVWDDMKSIMRILGKKVPEHRTTN